MSGIVPFVQDESAGYGILTLYTALSIYYFVTIQSESTLAFGFLIFSVGPALIVYEITEQFSTAIIKQVFEQHIAILRVKLEVEQGGKFDDWYEGDAKSEIDDLDQNAKEQVATALCSLVIGVTSPVLGYFAYGIRGAAAGLLILGVMVGAALYTAIEMKSTIERTRKVVDNEN